MPINLEKKFLTKIKHNFLLCGKKLFTPWNILIFVILITAFLVRIYRLPELLGFWYDQGRDALVIWDLIHNGKLFLIGPMMGNTGIFRGPWYYYLITPAYYFSNGNPLYANYFLIFISVLALLILYLVAKNISNKRVGLFALLIASFSSYIIGASRWLSNPTPTMLTGVVFVFSMIKFLEKRWWSLPLASFVIGMGLNFGAATELYLIPALLLILFLNKKLIPSLKIITLSVFVFVFTFLPQILFEVRHKGVMIKAFYNFVFNEKTFTIDFIQTLTARFSKYYDLFASKFWVDGDLFFLPFLVLFVYLLFKNFKVLWKNKKFQILFITFLAPFVGTLFFVSNLGGFYDYYFTAYYLVFILMFAVVLDSLWQSNWGRLVGISFLIIFSIQNYNSFEYYKKPLNDPEIIAFKNQLDMVEWIKNDSDADFNVDVYVPPVIPHAYDYLFKWQNLDQFPEQTSLLYTVYEVDPPHPERLEAWLDRQEGIGMVVDDERFGGIVVQKRYRIEK